MRAALLVGVLALTGCAHGGLFRSRSAVAAEARADSLYWSAVANLDPSNRSGTLDDAIANLEAYLAAPVTLKHATEAKTLRVLARNSQQLARLEAMLQTRAAAAPPADAAKPEPRPRPEPDRARDEEMVKEIQRLKDELAKANDELDRIKKRLAAQTKP